MARTLVVDSEQHTRVPFLRGILTRSLQSAGLSFEESYRVASAVRDELDHHGEISTDRLRKRVVAHLEKFGEEVVERYLTRGHGAPTIMVKGPGGHYSLYSRGEHRRELESSGMSGEEAIRIAAGIFDDLTERGITEITFRDLGFLTMEHIEEDLGDVAARNYVVWNEFRRSDRPLLVLVWGPVGSGKSTIATQLANQLGIVRIQSTDMLREVMRIMTPERLLPVLHRSTFQAWQALPTRGRRPASSSELLEEGYLTQAELVAAACEAAILRAIRERVSLIMEGVHLHPTVLKRIPKDTDAIVVPITLAVLKAKELRKRIKGRSKKSPDRRSERYLKNFDEIWKLQTFMLSEADRAGIPIVGNDERENTVHELVGIVMAELSAAFSGDPEEAFG